MPDYPDQVYGNTVLPRKHFVGFPDQILFLSDGSRMRPRNQPTSVSHPVAPCRVGGSKSGSDPGKKNTAGHWCLAHVTVSGRGSRGPPMLPAGHCSLTSHMGKRQTSLTVTVGKASGPVTSSGKRLAICMRTFIALRSPDAALFTSCVTLASSFVIHC